MKWIIPFYLALTVACFADRADMDRLMGDIQNHNRKLGEVISTKNAAEIKTEAVALREDAKALFRKSAGLTETEKTRLEQRVAAIERLTQQTLDYTDQSDYAKALAVYQRMQPQIRLVNSIAERKAVKPATVQNNQNQLLTDVRNHNRRINETIAAQNVDETLMETFALREDVKALGERVGTANTRVETSKTEIVRLSDALEEHLADSNFAGAKATYRQMQPHLTRLIAAAEGTEASAAVTPVAPESTQLLADIQNHNRKLRESIAAKNVELVKQCSTSLREDAQALAETGLNRDAKDQTKLNAAVAAVVDLTQRVERNANRSAFGDVREHYQKMQPHIARLQTLAPNNTRQLLNNEIE